jgi:hypothetical protein
VDIGVREVSHIPTEKELGIDLRVGSLSEIDEAEILLRSRPAAAFGNIR